MGAKERGGVEFKKTDQAIKIIKTSENALMPHFMGVLILVAALENK